MAPSPAFTDSPNSRRRHHIRASNGARSS
uniref:Uncharacterized protein n=1 Tax=Arundo donax TaxID=35708 RepID=A0A0A9BLA8_ARUDO